MTHLTHAELCGPVRARVVFDASQSLLRFFPFDVDVEDFLARRGWRAREIISVCARIANGRDWDESDLHLIPL